MLRISTNASTVTASLDNYNKKLGKDFASRMETAAVFLEGKMSEKIISGLSPALKESTIARKGSSTPLIDTGQLISQIDHKRIGMDAEVGVFGSRATIARIHEFGAPRANIPERSFMRSSLQENRGRIRKIVGGK